MRRCEEIAYLHVEAVALDGGDHATRAHGLVHMRRAEARAVFINFARGTHVLKLINRRLVDGRPWWEGARRRRRRRRDAWRHRACRRAGGALTATATARHWAPCDIPVARGVREGGLESTARHHHAVGALFDFEGEVAAPIRRGEALALAVGGGAQRGDVPGRPIVEGLIWIALSRCRVVPGRIVDELEDRGVAASGVVTKVHARLYARRVDGCGDDPHAQLRARGGPRALARFHLDAVGAAWEEYPTEIGSWAHVPSAERRGDIDVVCANTAIKAAKRWAKARAPTHARPSRDRIPRHVRRPRHRHLMQRARIAGVDDGIREPGRGDDVRRADAHRTCCDTAAGREE